MKRPAQPVRWVRLGDYIDPCDERNADGRFGIDSVRGISIEKKVIPTKADMTDVSLSPYKVLHPHEFCFVTITSRNGGKISLAENDTGDDCIVSSSYEVFQTKTDALDPTYLYLWFCRPEFDRYARFNSWGSAREAFSMDDMKRVRIPLPDIDEQRRIVAAWRGLRNIKEQNEALAEPLMALCQSFFQDGKKKWPIQELGQYIEERNDRNWDYLFEARDLQGVACTHLFIKSIASTQGMDLKNHKIVRRGDFAYSNRINVGSIAYRDGPDCIVSPSYTVFHVIDEKHLIPEYLSIIYTRREFLRATLFFAYGTIKDDFSYDNMARYRIPLPPIDEQRRIVAIYEAAREAKRIAEEAGKLSEAICPALMRRAAEAAT